MSRRVEPYDEENDEIAQEKKKIKAKMAAEAIEEARKKALEPQVAATPHPGSDDLEALMTCCICMDRFRVPKMLPCQHSFCAHCLEGLFDWVKNQIKCPECRTEHRCSNPDNFPTNLTMVRFMEVHIEAMGGDPADAMAPPPSLQRCTVCGDNAELSKCSHCDRKVCTDCRDGHMEIMKRELGRLINQVKRGVSRLEESAGWIERNEAQLTQNCSVVREEIQDVVRRYLKQIKDREDLLLNQVNTFLQAETKSMQHMQDNIDEEIKTLNTAVEEAQKLLDPESNTSIDDVMGELSTFKEQFSKSVDFLKSFTPDAQDFTKSLKFVRGSSEGDLLHQSILAFGELHVSTQHFNRFVSNSERMATLLIEKQFEATLAEFYRQQQEEAEQAARQAARTVPQLPLPELDSGRTFQSEYMTRRQGESLQEYRDRRLESSPSRFTTAELPTPRPDYSRESSAPASYLARVSRLTDTSSSGADTATSTARGGGSSESTSTTGSNRRQKYKDGRSHTADLGLLRESTDERRNSGDDLDVEVAEALSSRGRYARRVESQDSQESVSGDGRRGGRYRGGSKTTELNDAFAVPDVAITPSRTLYQRETSTSDSPLRTSSTRGATATSAGASACEQAINRRRRRFATQASQEDTTPAITTTPASTTSSYSARSPYSASSATGARSRETSPVRRARTPALDESDDELARDREERMPFYSRYLANKAKSREVSPTNEYRASSTARDLGSASSALSRDSAYLNKGRTSTKIGSRGSEAGQLNWPRGVAAGSDNRVLVADSSNHRDYSSRASAVKDVIADASDAIGRATNNRSSSSGYNYRTRYVPRY
ncbi:hypothetical protein RvY_10817 [Ramazzottius varieornatus]|uniref:RING-type domain-containing protein n=1 Tax=Ramazzottius varieornatus TaxID=947166 RepID=A0A1D1VE11_RAMVA|nr:hypothetical protein RvY_10817 [Ramazzottius varieornatus]